MLFLDRMVDLVDLNCDALTDNPPRTSQIGMFRAEDIANNAIPARWSLAARSRTIARFDPSWLIAGRDWTDSKWSPSSIDPRRVLVFPRPHTRIVQNVCS
jgi:hypothetical protein